MSYRATFELPDNFSTTRYYDHSHPRITADAVAWAKEQMRMRGRNYSYVWIDVYFGRDSWSYRAPIKFTADEERLNRIEQHLKLSGFSDEWED